MKNYTRRHLIAGGTPFLIVGCLGWRAGTAMEVSNTRTSHFADVIDEKDEHELLKQATEKGEAVYKASAQDFELSPPITENFIEHRATWYRVDLEEEERVINTEANESDNWVVYRYAFEEIATTRHEFLEIAIGSKVTSLTELSERQQEMMDKAVEEGEYVDYSGSPDNDEFQQLRERIVDSYEFNTGQYVIEYEDVFYTAQFLPFG
jgi:hypothetical protein